MQPAQVLHYSHVDAFHCVILLYVECDVNKQAGGQLACNLVIRDHIRQQSEGMHCSEVKGALQVTPKLSKHLSYKVDTTTQISRFCFKESR